MMHIMEPDRGWPEPYFAAGDGEHPGGMAHSLFNARSWDKDQYDVFTVYTTLTGIIATDESIEKTASCMFPSDGASDQRSEDGCGKASYRPGQEGFDLCDEYV